MDRSASNKIFAFVFVFFSAVLSLAQQPVYLDASKSIEQRADDLLGRMTLEEKVGQMNMPCSYLGVFGRSHEDKLEFARKFTEGTLHDYLGPGGPYTARRVSAFSFQDCRDTACR